MKFFIPHVAEAELAATYDAITKSVKEQMRVAVNPRKIFSLSYIHDNQRLKAEVGQPDPQEGRYEVCAILEAKPYVIYTRRTDGGVGLNMLVNPAEVTDIVDFE